MKISVIVPVYNVEKYLDDCLKSLINQTFKDMEIICINDGSTDNSLEILKKYPQIKLINKENGGQSSARNAGISIAQGEYIGFIDSDDWIDNDFYEKLYNAIVETGSDIAAASILRGKTKYRVKYTEQKICISLEDKINESGYPNSSYVWNKLYKAELVKQNLFKEGVFFEDVIWTPEVLKQASQIVFVPKTEYHYRKNSKSTVKLKPSAKKQEDFYNARKLMVKFFDDNHLSLKEKFRYITKKRIYLFNFLLLKIKEYKNSTIFYLFGFIPIFKISNCTK